MNTPEASRRFHDLAATSSITGDAIDVWASVLANGYVRYRLVVKRDGRLVGFAQTELIRPAAELKAAGETVGIGTL